MLPRSHSEFRSVAFWEAFFAERQRAGGTFEWYGEWKDFQEAVAPLLRPDSKVLVSGCGNSALSADLYDWGAKHVVNVDFSKAVITEMQSKNATRPEMQWVEADATALPFPDHSFDVVFDKGLLDAMAAEDTPAVCIDVRKMFLEAARVLAPGGVFVCLTLAQSHVLRELLAFPNGTIDGSSRQPGWDITVNVLESMQQAVVTLCPVLVVARKLAVSADGAIPARLLRLATRGGETVIASEEETGIAVREGQWNYDIRRKSSVVERGNKFSFEVWSERARPEAGPRYSITALDYSRKQTCGVLLVPQGREHEWSFSDVEGMSKVVADTNFGRLYFVYLNRGHTFPDQEAIKVCVMGNGGCIKFSYFENGGSASPFRARCCHSN
jgi:SAM-dependent methyltransferase